MPISPILIDAIKRRYQGCMDTIRQCSSQFAFVSLHCCFRTRSAFYSALPEFVKLVQTNRIRIAGIITLVDDFYSTYFRIREYYRVNSINETVNPLDILYWRNVDLMLAHMLATQLDIKHYVVSVNHPLSLLKRLILEEHATVYAGHPITDIREKDPSARSRLMRRVNEEQLVPLTQTQGLVTFIPDTIDEVPLLGLPRPTAPDSEPPQTYTLLKERQWPRTWLASDDPPISAPVQDSVAFTYYDDLLASIMRNREMYGEAVYGQISDRDYRLVNQSLNFLFSLLNDVPSSKGVESELFQARRYPEKNEYFLNPDSIQSTGPTRLRPNWADHVTAENNRLDILVGLIQIRREQPLLRA